MDVDSARAMLGIEPGSTAEQLKRAYLRSVRTHSPERDPEGFQRVRQAFELLQALSVLRLQERDEPRVSIVLAPDRGVDLSEAPTSIEHSATVPAHFADAPPAEAEPSRTRQGDFSRQHVPRRKPPSMRQRAELLIVRLREASGASSASEALDMVLEAVAAGKLVLARRLFEAFASKVERERLGALDFSADVAVRWKLVEEVIALTHSRDVPASFARAAAAAVRAERYSQARTCMSEMRARRHFNMAVLELAPNLERLIEGEPVAARVRPRSFRWPWVSLAVILFCSWGRLSEMFIEVVRPSSERASNYHVPRTPPAVALAAPSQAVADESKRDPQVRIPALDAAANALAQGSRSGRAQPLSTDEELDVVRGMPTRERLFALSGMVNLSISTGDCSALRTQWPEYVVALQLASDERSRSEFELRKARARQHCDELDDILLEEP